MQGTQTSKSQTAVRGIEFKNTMAKRIQLLFNDELCYNLFNSRCNDTGDSNTIENAKIFKLEYIKRNHKTGKVNLNL